MSGARRQSGFTLLEILIALAMGAIVVTVLASVVTTLTESRSSLEDHGERAEDARFAMDRMIRAVRGSRDLLLPLVDSPDTDWRENVREQTIPASLPEGSSSFASAVLAVSLSARIDLDADGIADADNDGDGRIDEDLPDDMNFDGSPGIHGVDDVGDGIIDNGADPNDDDEWRGLAGEDPGNGLDDDGDGLVDEDLAGDMNADGAPGRLGVDDDGDGSIDEGADADDDEDGSSDEDWLDAVVFFLRDRTLIERHPVPWDVDSSNGITGGDFVEMPIAENVTRFRVERRAGAQGSIVDITLEIGGSRLGDAIGLQSTVRVGAAP